MEGSARRSWRSTTITCMKYGVYPLTWLCNRFLATFRSTTREEEARLEDPCYERYVILSFILPFYVICIVLYAPIAAICFLIWIALQSAQPSYKSIDQSDAQDSTLKWSRERIFHVTSINTYLMPEFSARYYNLGNTQERTRRIIDAVLHPEILKKQEGIDNVAVQYDSDSEYDYRIDQDTPTKKMQQHTLHKVSVQFYKDLDVVCLQGVFEHRAQKKLVENLQGKFPYIVSDCEVNSWSTNRFRWPSGLVVASRWLIEDACFKPFTASCTWDKNISKGVLIVKVCDRKTNSEVCFVNLKRVYIFESIVQMFIFTFQMQINSVTERNVAYIINTHLQEGYGQGRSVAFNTHASLQIKLHEPNVGYVTITQCRI